MMPPPSPSNEPTTPAGTPMINAKNTFSNKLCIYRTNSFQESNKWFVPLKEFLRILVRELLQNMNCVS
jgi:hypothetical protein